jgi:putative ABC transport system ATP-binding protein
MRTLLKRKLPTQPTPTADYDTRPSSGPVAARTADSDNVAPAAAAAVTARSVVKTYGRDDAAVRALDGVSLDIVRGQFSAIMGPSGSGKSTLMHVLAGLDDVDAGSIHLGHTDVCALDEKRRTILRRTRVGFVFQAFNLVPALTAAENIALPLTLAGQRPDPEWLELLVTVLGLGDRLEHRPGELSGGQQQRVAAARALITRPEVVFADEPTGNLDSRHGHALLEFLRDAAHTLGQTVVMVTHDPTAAAYADRAVFLADGRLVADLSSPTVTSVLDQMAHIDDATDHSHQE